MHFIQKSIKDWIVKSLQKSILLRDFSDFIEVFDFSDGFTIQSQSDYKMIWDQISLWNPPDPRHVYRSNTIKSPPFASGVVGGAIHW